MRMFPHSLLSLFVLSLLVAQDSPPDDRDKHPENAPLPEPVPVTPPPDSFSDPAIVEMLKKIHEQQSRQVCLKAAVTVKRSNPLLKKPTTSAGGTLWVKRTANGHLRVLWEEMGHRVVLMNNSSTYVKWEGGKDAFEFPHARREKYMIGFPLLHGVTKSFMDQFDLDFIAIPVDENPATLPPTADPPTPPPPPERKTQRPPKVVLPPQEIREVVPPQGVVDPPATVKSDVNSAEEEFPTSKTEYIIRLIPKLDAKPGDPYASSLKKTTIWIDMKTMAVTRLTLQEASGEFTEMIVTKPEILNDIPEITFTQPLDGVRIIEAK